MAPSKHFHQALFLLNALVCIMAFFRRHARVFSTILPHFELHQDSSQPRRRPRAQEHFITLSYLHSMLQLLLGQLLHRCQPGSPAPSPLTMDTATRHRVNRNKSPCAWYPASHVEDRPGPRQNKPVGQAPNFARLSTITSQHQQRHLPSAGRQTTISRYHCGTLLQAGSCRVTPLQYDLGCPFRRHRCCSPTWAHQKPTRGHSDISQWHLLNRSITRVLACPLVPSPASHYDGRSAKVNIDKHIERLSSEFAFKLLSSEVTFFVTLEEHYHSNRSCRILHFNLVDDSDFAANSRLVFTIEYNRVADTNDAVLITNYVGGLTLPNVTAEHIRFQTGVEPQSHRPSEQGAAWLFCLVSHLMEGRNLLPKNSRGVECSSYKTDTRGRRSNLDKNSQEGQ